MARQAATLAKLTRPRLYEAVPRERLFSLLDNHRQLMPVTLVAAPPGAGKTTLVASYLETRKLTGIWYQVDAGDSDPSTFFYFLGLAERALSGKRKNLPPLPPLTPEYLPDLSAFSRRFFRELFLRMDTPAIVVFDYFQEAGEEGAFHSALVAALDEVPSGIHVFLVSRHPPPDRYARLAANRAMGLLDWDTIKLSWSEASDLLSLARLPIDEQTAKTLHERSGGWAAGLVLLTEQFRCQRNLDASSETDSLQQVFAYFAGQLFDQMPHAEQRILLQLSFFPSMGEGQARELTGSDAASRLLETLFRRHLFTDRRRGAELIYTFHALFRAFLQHRTHDGLSAAERVDAARRAARLLEAGGQSDTAMPLYVSTGDYEAAEALVQKDSATLIGQGRWKVVVDWIDALPSERVNANPWLLHWLGTAQIGIDPGRARTIVERAYRVALDQQDAFCQLQCAAGMIETYFLEYSVFTPIDAWIRVLEQMFATGFEFPNLESELRAQSAMLIATTYRQPDHPNIDRCVQKVRELLGSGIDINLRVSAGTYLTIYGSFTGHLDESQRSAAIVAPLLADPAVHIFRKIFAWAVINWYTCNVGDYELGGQAIANNENIARDEGMHIAERFACIIGSFLDMDRRDFETAQRRIERFEKIMIPSQLYEAASIENMKSYFGLFSSNPAPTHRHAPEALRLYKEAGSIPHIMVGLNGSIWGYVETGDEQAARSIIAEHRQYSDRRNVGWAAWGADGGEAILALRSGDEPVLCERLHRIFAVDRHRLDQYGYQLAWCRSWAALLASAALERDIEPERVRRYIRAFDFAPPSRAIESWPWPVKIYTLGRFELHLDGKLTSFVGKAPRKSLALIQAIVAMGSLGVKDYLVIDALWPDADGDVARDAYRVALHRLRKLLGNADSVLSEDGRLTLNPALCWVDALACEELLQPMAGSLEDGQSIDRLMRLYRGAFLADEPEQPWSVSLRERLRGKFVRRLVLLGAQLEQSGQYDQAAELYLRGTDTDSVTETFYQGLMRCYRALGRDAEALAVYRRMRQVLSALLGTEPCAESQALYGQFLVENKRA